MAQTGRVYYTGLFKHGLDEKGRLTVPSQWRAFHAETDTLLATPHPGGYIAVLPPAEVDKLYEKISAQKMSNPAAEAFAARFFSQTQALTFDKQGRVALNEGLLKHAGLTKDSVMVGMMAKFNIYNPARWEKEEALTAGENYGDFMRQLEL